MAPVAPTFRVEARTKFLLVVVLMVASMASLPRIPTLQPWGADLHNIHVYEKCTRDGTSPYKIDGRACGDQWGRSFIYPPVQRLFFLWSRPLQLGTAMYLWTAFVLVSFAAVFHAWVRKIGGDRWTGEDSRRHEIPVFCVLLLLQYPFVFALERGNTDAVNVLLFTLAAYLFTRRRLWLAGAAAGFAAGFKLSPAIAVIVIVGALGLTARRAEGGIDRWAWLRFGAGAFLAFTATLLVSPADSLVYLRDVLPKHATAFTPVTEWGHSIPTFVGSRYPRFGTALALGLMAVWAWAAARALRRGEDDWAFAGALAVSTYVQRVSFDYNLITTYPLLLLLFLRARRTDRWGLLVFGLFSIAGDRRLFSMPNAQILTPYLHLQLQVAFLLVTALVIGRGDDAPAASPAPTS
jgi:glycosyl transferase family 87